MKRTNSRKIMSETFSNNGNEKRIELSCHGSGDPVQFNGYDCDATATVGENGVIDLTVINPETEETSYYDGKKITGDVDLVNAAIKAAEAKYDNLTASDREDSIVDRKLDAAGDRRDASQEYADSTGNGIMESHLRALVELVTEVVAQTKSKKHRK